MTNTKISEQLRLTVRQARQLRGYTIREMAELINMKATTYARKERFPSTFYVEEAVHFARTVGVPLDSLIFLD